jgi:hypothetical protein
MRWRLLAVIIGLAVVAALSFRVFDRGGQVAERSALQAPSPGSGGQEPEPASDRPAVPAAPSEPRETAPAERTVEQRVAVITQKMAVVINAHDYEPYVDRLVKTGLARADSELIVRRFLDDVAVCAFESSRRYYEEGGTSFEDFLAQSERVWSKNPSPDNFTGLDVRSVAQLALPCVADAGQRAGIAVPS